MASILGILVNVDWHGIFRSFYERVKAQVVVRDISKIPADRMVEIDKELYLLSFMVEEEPVLDTVIGTGLPGGKDGSDHDLLYDVLEKEQQTQGAMLWILTKTKQTSLLGLLLAPIELLLTRRLS